jgi:hypothetical protein
MCSSVSIKLPSAGMSPALRAEERLWAPSKGQRLVLRQAIAATILGRVLHETWTAIVMECAMAPVTIQKIVLVKRVAKARTLPALPSRLHLAQTAGIVSYVILITLILLAASQAMVEALSPVGFALFDDEPAGFCSFLILLFLFFGKFCCLHFFCFSYLFFVRQLVTPFFTQLGAGRTVADHQRDEVLSLLG